MLGRFKIQRGDTIIEVMIALAILGLAFGISYATANHALQVAQTSQEHSQALELLDSQVELARAYVGNLYSSTDNLTQGSAYPYFCLGSDGAINITSTSLPDGSPVPNPACVISPGGGAEYVIHVQYNPAPDASGNNQDIFTFNIAWYGLGTLGAQHEQISYKLHNTAQFAIGAGGSIGSGIVPPPSCPTGEVGTPPYNCHAPPLPVWPTWQVNGDSYAGCVAAEPKWNDGYDGCFKNGTTMYAWREIEVTYDFSSANPPSGAATLIISYNQYNGKNSTAPSGYPGFELSVSWSNPSGNSTVTLPIAVGQTGWTPVSNSASVNIPQGSTSVTLTWINNTNGLGGDPNLQINNIKLSQ